MDNEYMNQSPNGNGTPNPEAYQYPPTNQSPAYPEYQQAAYSAPAQPVYDATYGQYTAQPSAQAPYGQYTAQAPAQTPYGGYGQPSAQTPYGEYSQPPVQTPYGAYGQPPAQAPYGTYNQTAYPTPAPQKSSGVFATLGMIFGIVGLSFSWFPFLNVLALLLSVVGIPFSAIGKKSSSGKAIAGLVTSIIGTIIGFLFFAAYSGSGLY